MLKDIVRRLAGPTLLVAIGFVGHQLFVLGAEEINRAVLLILAVRVFAIAWAGWLVVRGHNSLRVAALAGIVLHAVDMVVLTGGSFLVHGEFRAFANAVITTAVAAPVAAALAALGGYAAKQISGRMSNREDR